LVSALELEPRTLSLTARSVENAKSDPIRRLELPDGALPGFYLLVQPSRAKSWAVRYRVDGKPKKFTLGPCPRLSLGDAREQARTALRLASEGRDPAALRITVERGLLDASPMASLRPPSSEEARDRVLTDDEPRAVWLAAEELG
jgi:hypothetical protein